MPAEKSQQQFERLLVGAILHRPELSDHIDLSPDMFSSGAYREAFAAIQGMRGSSELLDLFSLADRLDSSSGHGGWLKVLTKAMNDCYAPGNGKLYAGKVREGYRVRQTKAIASTLAQDIDGLGMEAVDSAISALMDLGTSQRCYDKGVSEAIHEALDYIDKIYNLDGALPGVTSGLTELDAILGGYHDADLTVIAARPSMGKTAILLNMALAADVPVGIISSEQPGLQVATRFIAMEGRMNANKLRNADLDDEAWTNISNASSKLFNRKIRINDKSGISISELVRQARIWKHHYGTAALYVDYLQRIKASDTRAPRHEQVGQVIMTLKELARDLEMPVIVLAQVNRDVEKRTNKRPGMGDIKDSGTVEQEADTIMTLYRDEVYNQDSQDKGTAELDVVKNRHGPTGFIRVVWLAECMRFMNHEHADKWSGPVEQESAL